MHPALHLPHHDTDRAFILLQRLGVWGVRIVTDSAGRRLLQLPTREAAAVAMLLFRGHYGTTGRLVGMAERTRGPQRPAAAPDDVPPTPHAQRPASDPPA